MNTIDQAFQAVQREDFLPEEVRSHAHADRPFSIGYGQTNSQPSTVRAMLEWLEVEEGQSVLDVGSGSGWTTALLAKLVGKKGHVYAVELVPELAQFGQENCERVGITNAAFYEAEKEFGLRRFAPYDRILVSASANSLPDELLEQLHAPGRMVIPVGNSIYEVDKDEKGDIDIKEHYGFVFVPLVP